jgi:hypothetical protein
VRISSAICQPITPINNHPTTPNSCCSLPSSFPHPPFVATPGAYISSPGASDIPPAPSALSPSPAYPAGSGRSKCSRMRPSSRCKGCLRCGISSGFCRGSCIAGRERESRWTARTSRSTRRRMLVPEREWQRLHQSAYGILGEIFECGDLRCRCSRWDCHRSVSLAGHGFSRR